MRKLHIYLGIITGPILIITVFIGVLLLIFGWNFSPIMGILGSFHTQSNPKSGFGLHSTFGIIILSIVGIGCLINTIMGLIMARKFVKPIIFNTLLIISLFIIILSGIIPLIQ